MKELVAQASTEIRKLGANDDLSTSLLVQNLMFNIGNAMRISSKNARYTNEETPSQEKVSACQNF